MNKIILITGIIILIALACGGLFVFYNYNHLFGMPEKKVTKATPEQPVVKQNTNQQNVAKNNVVENLYEKTFIDPFLGAPQSEATPEQFTIQQNASQQSIVDDLYNQGFIKNELAFNYVLNSKNLNGKIQPGGYKISKSMTAMQVADTFSKGPYLIWVVIPEGLRKEQIAEILAKDLGWTNQQKSDWILNITTQNSNYLEGVYFPNTYLIPKDETPADTAQRLIDKFNSEFAPYQQDFTAENIKWITALKVASIVQREGLGEDDMPLIAGIIWNRLQKNMNLEVDATVQYARDSAVHFSAKGDYISQGAWWSPITSADEKIDSPYNTYLNAGLPPEPIDSPGLEAIDATFNSTDTDCLYYLHDSSGQIHCASTLQEHDANIEEYLK
jgi:UPF0755 protein